ncbi:MAG: L,D-transpeptidase [Coriobacteriia bacterium]|nr:L,D-transpeptidase [Coriobacteriia bacterium]
MHRFTKIRSLLALSLALALVLGSVPAYGAYEPAFVDAGIPSHATVNGVDLFGMDDVQARAAIASAAPVPTLLPLVMQGDGHTVTVQKPARAVSLNVDAMLASAYSAVDTATPFALAPTYSISTGIVTTWYNMAAKAIDHKAKNAVRKRKGHSLYVTKEADGHKVNKTATISLLRSAVTIELADVAAVPATITVPLTTLKPKVTRKNIPKAILVVLSHYQVKLYRGTGIEKKYKIAIGMPGFSTPTGKWKVTGKKKNPSWHNPGSAWAKNMPSVIGPGPNNPLGTRAIYINASGIRFHGTAKWWSIGHAASHGCMRMKRKDVEDFYPRVPVGTTVWIVK